jgi:hypothetical protein
LRRTCGCVIFGLIKEGWGYLTRLVVVVFVVGREGGRRTCSCVIVGLVREGWGYLNRLVVVVRSEKEGGEPAAALSSVL